MCDIVRRTKTLNPAFKGGGELMLGSSVMPVDHSALGAPMSHHLPSPLPSPHLAFHRPPQVMPVDTLHSELDCQRRLERQHNVHMWQRAALKSATVRRTVVKWKLMQASSPKELPKG